MYQAQDPIITRPYYRNSDQRIVSEVSSRMSPGVNVGQGKVSYSPGHWKKYITSQTNLRSPQRKSSAYDSNYKKSNFQDEEIVQNFASGRNSLQQNQISKFQQQKRRKQQMIKRVQQIQKKVMPILKSKNNQQFDQNFGWYNRMQQRILKLETNVDSIQKQLQIKFEKRILEVQKQWTAHLQSLIGQSPQNNQPRKNKLQMPTKVYHTIKTLKNQLNRNINQQQDDYITQDQKYGMKERQQIRGHKRQANQQTENNSQGFFTKRENKYRRIRAETQNQ